MTSATPTNWSGLFQNIASTSSYPGTSSTGYPPSRLLTEHSIQNDALSETALIKKANSLSCLLDEMVVATNEEQETMKTFQDNDLLQSVYQECQDMSEYLNERIWNASEVDMPKSYTHTLSSSTAQEPGLPCDSAMVASLISCLDTMQQSNRRYLELKDFLRAKEIQQEEIARANALDRTFPLDIVSSDDDGNDMDDEEEDYDNYTGGKGISVDGHDAMLGHLRKANQPLLWKLDPRDDFKANKSKNKKFMDKQERQRIQIERHEERSEVRRSGIHRSDSDSEEPMPSQMVEVQGLGGADSDIVLESAAVVTSVNTTTPTVEEKEERTHVSEETVSVQSTNQDELQDIELDDTGVVSDYEDSADIIEQPKGPNEEHIFSSIEKVTEIEDDVASIMSDESWEEIPEAQVVAMSEQDSTRSNARDRKTTTSSTSSSSASSSVLI